ncbi:MAG: hypothetical protein P8Y70_11940 [Candidatus Lokiarchaeota archaeon]
MITIPNWIVHLKWALKFGINENIAHFVNRSIDYGSDWYNHKLNKNDNNSAQNFSENSKGSMVQQLQYFYEKDPNSYQYVEAAYIHYILDYFRETRYDLYDFDFVFKKFIEEKGLTQIYKNEQILIDFSPLLKEIFLFLKKNKEEVLYDLM